MKQRILFSLATLGPFVALNVWIALRGYWDDFLAGFATGFFPGLLGAF